MLYQVLFNNITDILDYIDENKSILNYFYGTEVNEFTKTMSHYSIYSCNEVNNKDFYYSIINNQIDMVCTNSKKLMKFLVDSEYYYTDDDTPQNRKKIWTLHFISKLNDNN